MEEHLAERQRDHREVDAAPALGEVADHDPDHDRGRRPGQQCEQHVHAMAHHQPRGHEPAGAEEHGLAEREQAGEAEQDREPQAEQAPDQDQAQHRHVGGDQRQHERPGQQRGRETGLGQQRRPPCGDRRARSHYARPAWPKKPCGRSQQDQRHHREQHHLRISGLNSEVSVMISPAMMPPSTAPGNEPNAADHDHHEAQHQVARAHVRRRRR